MVAASNGTTFLRDLTGVLAMSSYRGQRSTEAAAKRVSDRGRDLNDDPRLLGTKAWQARKRHAAYARGKDYSQEREIKHLYRHLSLLHGAVERINDHADTITGKEVSAAMVNYLDLELAVRSLPTKQQRDCWNVCIIGRICVYDTTGKYWMWQDIPRMSYNEASGGLGLTVSEIEQSIKRATAFMLCFLYETGG